MLEQDLRAQVEKVRRLVEQEQRGLVEEQGGELDAGLPASRELLHGAGEMLRFQLELAGHLAALPVGLAAVAHQEVERRFTGQEGIVLAEIAELEPGMADDLTGVEFLLPEDDPQERALAGTVAADEPDLAVVGDRGRGAVEQHLVAVALRNVLDVEQNRHAPPPSGRPDGGLVKSARTSRNSAAGVNQRRAWDSNPQPLSGHDISSVAASHSLTLQTHTFSAGPTVCLFGR